MKHLSISALGFISLFAVGTHGFADVTISPDGDLGQITQMPGSSTNYDFVAQSGTNSDAPGAVADAYDLTDFTVAQAQGGHIADFGQSSILPPGGTTAIATGVYFAGTFGDAANLATFTLSDSTPTSFNYADFNVYVTYSTVGGSIFRIGDIALAEGGDATGASATVIDVSDTNTDSTMGRVVEFNIVGASAGDIFTLATTPTAAAVIAANGGGAGAYISGLSFESVPEPSTYAMLLGGIGALGLIFRLRGSKLSA